MKLKLLAAAGLSTIAAAALAQGVAAPGSDKAKTDKPKWDVAAPPVPTRQIKIDTDEGTWMNVAVSPDGKTIAFDLLGDIYTMPIAGGTPSRIAEGLPFEMQPQFSPDGKRIAFTSDRGGGDNIWIMNIDGSDKRQVTKEKFRLLNEPTWSPDGRYLAARKHFTTGRSLGTGEIWLYHLGGGDGVKLVKRASEQLQKELGEPAYSSDGRSIYYTRNTTRGPIFEYAQDSTGEVFDIEKYDLATGETSVVTGGAGGAVRPTPSPDGKKLAFVRREDNRSTLCVEDLATGAITTLAPLDLDMQETWAVHGVYPTMGWTPDAQSIVFWAGGKIRRVDMAGNATVIPFHVSDTRDVIDPPQPKTEVAPANFATKMARYASVSPDSSKVVFESLGKMYVKSLPNGAPRRLTKGDGPELELFPSWSRDGKQIVLVEWTDAGLGHVKTIAAAGGAAKTVTATQGHYRRPRFSPDGRTIVYERGQGGNLLSDLYSSDPGIYRVAAEGGTPAKITTDGEAPQFGAANDRVFVTMRADDKTQLVSFDLNGEAKRVHASGDLIAQYEVSPAGDEVAFRDNYAAYVMPLTPGPQNEAAGTDASAVPVVKASAGGANYFSWSEGGKRLNWTLGSTLFSSTLDQMMPSLPKPKDDDGAKGYEAPTTGSSLSIDVAADRPSGKVALVGARIVTMAKADGGVIENGTIVVDSNRIVAIGPSSQVAVPADAKRVDVAGKTIIPGLIDAHAHGPQGDDDIVPNQNWSNLSALALGVTTVFNPSSRASEIFEASEMQRAGKVIAPRIYSTAEIVYGAKAPGIFADIQSYDDALAHVRRLKAQGAISVKNYNQPRRDQRQQVVAAAAAENMMSVAEGGSLFTMDMTLIADGNTALEHNIPQSVYYNDVLQFFSQTKVAYTPTLVVTYGGLAGDPYWRMATDVWKHPILSRHAPPAALRPGSVRRTKAPDDAFVDQYSAAQAKKLQERGVVVTIGAHGQEEGLAAHWELWSFGRGGMSPVQALRTGTIDSARKLGMERDIGSLETGKLADLVILDANPLENIRNSDQIDKVMLNGRLYDAITMDETVTGTRKRLPYYWQTPGAGKSAPARVVSVD